MIDRRFAIASAALFGVALAVSSATAPAAPPPPVDAATAAFVAGDCARCHVVPGVAPLARQDSCTDCHVWIKEVSADPARRAKAMQAFPYWKRYEKVVASYLKVPSLEAAMVRLDPAWVRGYLKDPFDVRPHLHETMPRFALTDAQIDAIVAKFTEKQAKVPPTPAPDPKNLEKGERVFKGTCIACHPFGGRSTAGIDQGPDLMWTRDRMNPDVAAAWIKDPRALSPASTMVSFGLSDADVIAVRDFVYLADPKAEPAPPMHAPPEPVARAVAWAEVEEKVFGKICRHCHMDPKVNQGRAGPGNAGGFGYPATGIDLESYEGVVAAKDRLAPALLRRRLEAQRDAVSPGTRAQVLTRPEKPGMPLGLPPIPDEDLAIVLAWIDQGCPR